MFWSKDKKKIYPCKPQFYYIKVGCKGVFVTPTCFRDGNHAVEGGDVLLLDMSFVAHIRHKCKGTKLK